MAQPGRLRSTVGTAGVARGGLHGHAVDRWSSRGGGRGLDLRQSHEDVLRIVSLWAGPVRDRRMLSEWSELSLYEWNTKTAKHYFCKTCGVFPFHRPRTAPELWGINVRCLEGVDASAIPIKYVHGSRLS